MGGHWVISSSKQVAIGHGIPAQRLWHNVVFQLPCGLKLMGQQYPMKALDVESYITDALPSGKLT